MDDFELTQLTEAEAWSLFEEAVAVTEGSTPERAVQMLRDVLVALSGSVPADAEEMVWVRMYLGRSLWLSRLAEQAEPILRAAWVDAVRKTGRESRLSLSCAGNLCRVLGERNQFEEAFMIALDTYDIREEQFGELDNGTLNSLGHIAHLQFDAGLVREGVETMTELLARRTEAFGGHDPRTESSRYNLAVMQARLENRDDHVAGDAIEYFTDLYGEDSAPVINLHAQLGAIHARNGRLEEALGEWTYVERMRADLHGEVAIPTLAATVQRLVIMRRLGAAGLNLQIAAIGRTVECIAGSDHSLALWCAELVAADRS